MRTLKAFALSIIIIFILFLYPLNACFGSEKLALPIASPTNLIQKIVNFAAKDGPRKLSMPAPFDFYELKFSDDKITYCVEVTNHEDTGLLLVILVLVKNKSKEMVYEFEDDDLNGSVNVFAFGEKDLKRNTFRENFIFDSERGISANGGDSWINLSPEEKQKIQEFYDYVLGIIASYYKIE